MADGFDVKIVGDTALIARFDGLPAALQKALFQKITALDLKLESKVKHKLSNDVLHVRSGNLRASIHGTVDQSATSVTGKVASSGDVKYAAIHEFGGRTAAHDIMPTKAHALTFVMGGKNVFAKVVHHPGSVIPERSYLRSSLADMKQEIVEGLASAGKAAAREAMKK